MLMQCVKPTSEVIMTRTKLLAVAFALAVLNGCSAGGYHTSNSGPANNPSADGYYPNTGGSN